ncbi:mfs multidrug transporter [Moniliophthora roreri MCA 2997]|uniref:Mfs multidrug transporter n=1 Tax=Moniliophthora roreri (strain MCA 2997) TaxID=1381753 RepID=V2XTN2_MONRO|nr:mfs multidrug transporter [Moniliophthora roreri MCA 2997]
MIITLYRYLKRKWSKDSTSTAQNPEQRREWIFRIKLAIALAVPIFLETLDYTVVATAQTEIASVFNRLDLQSYIGTLYLLTSTVFLPLFASVADIYGRHFAMQASMLFFIFGSALSTGANNMEMMLAGRGIAGIGAAGLLTVVRIIISDSGSLDDNNWQVSILFLLYAIGYSVGPVIGGYLSAVSFRWIFAINLPACVLSMILVFVLLRKHLKEGFVVGERLPDSEKPRSSGFMFKLTKVDWIGTFLFVAAGILVLLALNWGSTEEWNSAKVITCFVIGGLLFCACILWEYVLERDQNKSVSTSSLVLSAYPMIPLDMFRNIDICTVMAASFVGGMVMIVMFYFVAIFMTVAAGLDPRNAGIQLVYFAPGSGVGTLMAIQMTKRLRQPKYAIQLGSLLLPISLGLISMGIQESEQGLVNGFLAMAGVGCGLTIGSLNVHARFSQPPERVAIVSALILFFRSLGGTVGLAQCGAVLNARVKGFIVNAVLSGQTGGVNIEFGSANSLGSLEGIGALPESIQTIIRSAFRDGVRWCFISLVPWAGVAFLLTAFFLTNIADPNREDDEKSRDVERAGSQIELNQVKSEPSDSTACTPR